MTRRETVQAQWRLARFGGWYSVVHGRLWNLMNLSALVPGLVVSWLFDTLAGPAASQSGVAVALAILAGISLGQTALYFAAGYVELQFRFRASALLRWNVLWHLLRRPGALALPYSLGETISRFRDDADLAEDSLDWSDEIIGDTLVTAVAVGILATINPVLTLAGFGPLVLVIILAQRASVRLGDYRAASSEAGSAVAGALGDLLTAVETLRAAGAEDRAITHLRHLNERRRTLVLRDRLATQVLNAIALNITGLGTGLIMLLAASQLQSGALTVGDFVLFLAYMPFVARFTEEFGAFLAQFQQSTVALERLRTLIAPAPPSLLTAPAAIPLTGPLPPPTEAAFGLTAPSPLIPATPPTHHHHLHEPEHEREPLPNPAAGPPPGRHVPTPANGARLGPPAAADGPDTAPDAVAPVPVPVPVLSARGLSYRHGVAGPGIHDIDLDLPPGTLTVVTGRVGTGKTTLVRALLGLLPASDGELRWQGVPLADPAADLIPPRAGYTAQAPQFFSLSLADNLQLGADVPPATLAHAVDDAMLGPDLAALPAGLDTLVGPRGVKLSGGQLQRGAVARMLARPAALLVIDDVSSALDVVTEQVLWHRLRDQRDTTILAVSHRRAALALADQIIVMHAGRIIARGPLAELLATSAEMRALWADDEPDPTPEPTPADNAVQ